jgi:hypothetical protein
VRAIPRILFERFLLLLMGLRYQLKPAAASPKELLTRIDWCQSIGAVLPVIDTIRGFELHSQGLRWALRAGEPARLARALVMEAGYRMGLSAGRDPRGRIGELLETARMLARAGGDPGALGWVDIVTGSTRWSAADWRGTVEHVAAGVDVLRRECAGMSWEINFGQTHLLNALFYLGRVREHRAETLRELDDARARGDLYAETMYTLRDLASARVLEDRPDDAAATVDVLARWTNRGFQIEHLVEAYQQTEVELYLGRGGAAIARMRRAWPLLQRAQLLRVEIFRVELSALRGRAALAAADEASDEGERSALVREAARLSRSVDRGPESVRRGVVNAPVAAGAALASGNEALAEARLTQGIAAAEQAGMLLWEQAMRHARGKMRGGAGRTEANAALSVMHDAGVVRPDRYVRVITPGFARASHDA